MNFRTSKATGALAALLLAAGCATTPTPVPASTGPALWAVADADTTIYLFGTVHALPKDVPWMRGKIGPALAASDTLVTEIDLATADTAAMQAFVMKNALLGEQENLRDLLTQAQRARFEAGTAKLGMPVGAFDRFEPWYAALMFALVPLVLAGLYGGVARGQVQPERVAAHVGEGVGHGDVAPGAAHHGDELELVMHVARLARQHHLAARGHELAHDLLVGGVEDELGGEAGVGGEGGDRVGGHVAVPV